MTAVGFLIPRHIKRAITCEAIDRTTPDHYVQIGDILRNLVNDHWREYVSEDNRAEFEPNGRSE